MTTAQITEINKLLGVAILDSGSGEYSNPTEWFCPRDLYRITIVKWENIYTFNYNVYIKYDDKNEFLRVCTINQYTPEQYQKYLAKYESLPEYNNYSFPELVVYKTDVNGNRVLDNSGNPIIAFHIAPARGENGEILEDLYGYQFVKIYTWKVLY